MKISRQYKNKSIVINRKRTVEGDISFVETGINNNSRVKLNE